ncbi:hypothetical protein [Cryptosporangium sp. NPDC048952]|uniref:hypothetical protein n=1 Tax=Cryptosporangium sp. NPDC048952 TaxID=3363961 RepID=UPI003716DDEA
MNTWMKRGACLGVLSAGLVAAAAGGASAAPEPTGAENPVAAVTGALGDALPVAAGQGGSGGDGGSGNKVGPEQAVAPGERAVGRVAAPAGQSIAPAEQQVGKTVDPVKQLVAPVKESGTRVTDLLGIPGAQPAVPDGIPGLPDVLAMPGTGPAGGKGGDDNEVYGAGNRIGNGGSVTTEGGAAQGVDARGADARGAGPSGGPRTTWLTALGLDG